MKRYLKNNRGVSLIELVVTMVILGILFAMVLPTSHLTSQRRKEMELRDDLRTIRSAIDAYKKDYDQAVTEKKIPRVENRSGYPENLKKLIDGDDFGGLFNYKKRYLRRIPIDPFNPVKPDEVYEKGWGLRSLQDEPDSDSWGGQDVFDVYSLSEGKAIDGSNYKDW